MTKKRKAITYTELGDEAMAVLPKLTIALDGVPLLASIPALAALTGFAIRKAMLLREADGMDDSEQLLGILADGFSSGWAGAEDNVAVGVKKRSRRRMNSKAAVRAVEEMLRDG